VKFSSDISIQIFSIKNANPSFYEIHVENDYFPLPSKFEIGFSYIEILVILHVFLLGFLFWIVIVGLIFEFGLGCIVFVLCGIFTLVTT
jgi:hypothetical protein